MKVVFHIDELEKWNETANNVKKLLKEPPKIDIIASFSLLFSENPLLEF